MTATPSPANGPPDSSQSASRAALARERVHAMESLAAVIAHELRAGVVGVTSAAQLLRYSVPQDPVAEKSLGRILQESERLSSLHEALTEYATELPPRLSAGNPDAVWKDVIRAMRGALEASSIQLTHASADPAAMVRLDAEQLGRAFERALHHALGRVQSGTVIGVTSDVDGHWWTCAISASSSAVVVKPESARPTFPLMLAQRTAVAHGGAAWDHLPGEAPVLVTFRLPLTHHAE
jgi:light-regulated signal transduction histidine kinase (bacteriophytochrome)